MSGIASFLLNTISTALFGMENTTTPPSGPHEPSVEDVLSVKNVFFTNVKLPIEIIDVIIDYAEYWPHTTIARTGGQSITVRGGYPINENRFILRTYPLGYLPTENDCTSIPNNDGKKFPSIPPQPQLSTDVFPQDVTEEILNRWTEESQPRGEFPCRKIVFTLKSHDQGWGGAAAHRGTYTGAYTWFEVGKEQATAVRGSLPSSEVESERPNGGLILEASDRQSNATAVGPMGRMATGLGGSNPAEPPLIQRFTIRPSRSNEKGEENRDEPITITTRVISPEIQTRTTAHEPPRTETTFIHRLLPSDDCLQKNKVATRDMQDQTITWSSHDHVDPESLEAQQLVNQGRGPASLTGEYVRNLKIGDVVTVWAKARFGGWVNNVEEVKIDVYWAV